MRNHKSDFWKKRRSVHLPGWCGGFLAGDIWLVDLSVFSPFETTEVSRHPIAALGPHSGSSSQNRVLCRQTSARKVEYNQVTHGDRTFNPSSNNTFTKCPVNDPGSKFATSNESDISTSLLNSLDPPKFSNISGQNNMDIQTLVEMEELQDKEMEEAQDHRHRCEVEERNALKAYLRLMPDALIYIAEEKYFQLNELLYWRNPIPYGLPGVINIQKLD